MKSRVIRESEIIENIESTVKMMESEDYDPYDPFKDARQLNGLYRYKEFFSEIAPELRENNIELEPTSNSGVYLTRMYKENPYRRTEHAKPILFYPTTGAMKINGKWIYPDWNDIKNIVLKKTKKESSVNAITNTTKELLKSQASVFVSGDKLEAYTNELMKIIETHTKKILTTMKDK